MDFKGKVVLLSFFGTWSELSKKQMPHFEKFHKQYQKSGLVLLGITAEKDQNKLRQFVQKQGLSYPILIGDWKIFKAYKVGGVPDIYYIDPGGKVCARDVGFKPEAEKCMELQIKKLLDMIKCDDEEDSPK